MTAPGDDPTSEKLIETLTEAGDFEAAAEVFDALRLRGSDATSLLALQAMLYLCAPRPPDVQRAALAPWCNGALDQLARAGALLECAAGYRSLRRAFPGEQVWSDRLGRIETVLTPLSNPHEDPARSDFDALIARGATNDAWHALMALVRHEPHDPDLSDRLATLRDLLCDPLDTRSYGALSPEQAAHTLAAPVDVAAVAARIQQAVREGDLRGALADATALSEHAGSNPRWQRFRDALRRLAAWSMESATGGSDDEPTQRTGPIERADLWLRAGNLAQAREAIRSQLNGPLDADSTTSLAERLCDLDFVLDGTLPTPIPVRPLSAVVVVTTPLGSPEGSIIENTAKAHLVITEPASQPPPTGDVKMGKRKIVRLS